MPLAPRQVAYTLLEGQCPREWESWASPSTLCIRDTVANIAAQGLPSPWKLPGPGPAGSPAPPKHLCYPRPQGQKAEEQLSSLAERGRGQGCVDTHLAPERPS